MTAKFAWGESNKLLCNEFARLGRKEHGEASSRFCVAKWAAKPERLRVAASGQGRAQKYRGLQECGRSTALNIYTVY